MLLDLAPEILTRILLLLPAKSVITCVRVCRLLGNIISSTAEIQYYLHLAFAGLQDNTHCELPTQERLERLKIRENRWKELQPDFEKIIDIPFPTSGIYELTAGIYLLGNASQRATHHAYLPSTPSEETEWKELKTNDIMVDLGLSIHEHDLIAIVTTQPNPHGGDALGAQTLSVIRLLLKQASTGKPHPQAEQPDIFVMTTFQQRPIAGIEIVGDNLVLVLVYRNHPAKPDDQIFVYQWKTGELNMRFNAPYHSYAGPMFLTKDIFLLANGNRGALEFWNIPKSQAHPPPTQPLLVLLLPKLNPDKRYYSISARAEPNPTTSFRYSSKPFHSDPHHAIAIFRISIRNPPPLVYAGVPWSCSFDLFIHRSSLFNCIDKFSSDGELRSVPYDEWGPSISRWMSTEAFNTPWVTTNCGQRCVIVPDMAHETVNAPIILLNFNQNHVDKVLDQGRQENETMITSNEGNANGVSETQLDSSSSGISIEDIHTMPPGSQRLIRALIHPKDRLDDDQGCFENIVYSTLPFTAFSFRSKYKFRGVLLDEERLLGLQLDEFSHMSKVYLLHHG